MAWLWDFNGEGSSDEENPPSFDFASHGNNTITLTVTDADGDEDSLTKVINIVPPPPDADFGYNNSDDPTFSFVDLSVGFITGWFWDFGDGFDTTERYPEHTYVTNGIYTVTLIVSGPGGDDSQTRNVPVYDGAVP